MKRIGMIICVLIVLLCIPGTGVCGGPVEVGALPSDSSANGRTVEVGGIRYHYNEYPGESTAIIMIHGFSSSSYTWNAVAPRLGGEGYHVFAPDMKGFGWSDKPAGAPYDAVTLMEGIHDWMGAVGIDRAVLVGNSLGGAVAVLMAIRYPESVKGLVLIDAAGYPQDMPFIVAFIRLPLAGEFTKLIFGHWMVRGNLKEVFYDTSFVTDDKVDAYYERLNTPGALDAQMAVARSMDPEAFAPYRARFKDINIPTLVIWGEKDAWIPVQNGYRYANDIPGAKLEVIPRCGHMPQEEMPDRTVELILDFMEKNAD